MDINQINRAYCEQYYIEQYEKESKMKPHKHAELIKAWADGAEIEVKDLYGNWVADKTPNWTWNEYRIKPEPKHDVVLYQTVANCQPHPQDGFYAWASCCYSQLGLHHNDTPNLKLTFDGETGELKSAEVLK